MLDFGITYDMWGPDFAEVPLAAQYGAMLDQAQYADEQGLSMISFNEHHGSRNGYLPSPLTATAAVAARTSRIALRPLLLLPLYDPIKLAEDIAVADLISGGRLCPVLGAGYRAEEFRMFDKDLSARRRTMDSTVQMLRRAWSGEPFEYEGRNVRVMPRPAQEPHPPIVLGGSTAAAARAAARYADGFYPVDPRLWDIYADELSRLGRPPTTNLPPRVGPMFVHIAEDPDRDWSLISRFLINAIHEYREWSIPNRAAMGQVPPQFAVETEADLRTSEHYLVLTPEECVELALSLGTRGVMILRPGWGGFSPDLAWECVRLLVERVIPAVRNAETAPG